MEIIDRIVKSITEPKQTNVIWLNPLTGEFLVYGKRGWEVWGCLHTNNPDLPDEDEEIEFLAIPDNEIWYTTKNNEIYDPIYEGFYGTDIILKKQEDGFNKWVFNNPITTGTYKTTSTDGYDKTSSTFGVQYTGAVGVPLTSVILPNTLIAIPGYFAFNCDHLLKVNITNNVTNIGQYAFAYCDRLRDVHLGKSVQSIENDAFNECKCLTNINFPKSLSTIGDRAFQKCNIQKADLSNIKSIGENNFINSSLSYIDIRNCDYVGKGGFPIHSLRKADISCKTNFIHDSNSYPFLPTIQTINVYCDSIEEFLNSNISSATLNINENKKIIINNLEVTEIVIPETITSISKYAFYGFDTITSFTVHDNMDYISETAILNTHFYNNKENWDKNSVLYVGNYLLIADKNNVPSVYSIKEGTKIINARSLEGCTYLQELYIPKSVTEIGSNALSNNTNLKKITVDETNPNYVGFNNILYDRSSTSIIVVPPRIEGDVTLLEGITSIPEYTFKDRKSLASVVIPESVKSIRSSAFYGCSSLTSIVIGNGVTSIEYETFRGCSKLTSVTIGESVTIIKDSAFYNCNSLTSITIPNSVTIIGSSAFYGCNKLTHIVCNAVVPPVLGSYNYSFSNLEAIYVPSESVEAYKTATNWSLYSSKIQAIP